MLINEILDHEVFPSIGCTEPISCAYAAAVAAEALGNPVEVLELSVDPGTFKNGAAVVIPYSHGQKGNVVAAALGSRIAKPGLKMEVLKETTPALLDEALQAIRDGLIRYRCNEDEREFQVEVLAHGGGSQARCVVSGGHTRITCLEKDGKPVVSLNLKSYGAGTDYRERMKQMKLEEVLREAVRLDDETRKFIQSGIDMNMAMAMKGTESSPLATQLKLLLNEGAITSNIFTDVKLSVAAAVGARMNGLPEPVTTSGGSGNQGILATVCPCLVGQHWGIGLRTIQESVAVSHAVNAYIKCFVGELSVVCGCATAAAIGTAVALVYQKAGIDMEKITFAINNVIGDLCGIICDGAKPGCALKVATGADVAMRSAIIACLGYGFSTDEGVLGRTPEESIRNLSRVSFEGMFRVDPTIIQILQEKVSRSGQA